MGKRMGRKWDLPWEYGGILIILCASFFLGGISGCLMAALSGGEGAQELGNYLKDYLLLARDYGVPCTLWSNFWEHGKYLLVAVLLGFTSFGIVGVPVLLAVRGFFFSFSVGCFFRVFGSIGLFPAFAIFGLPALLWIPALFMMGVQSLYSSKVLLRRTLGTGARESFCFGRSQWVLLAVCAGLVTSCVLIEYFIVPVLLQAAAHVVL